MRTEDGKTYKARLKKQIAAAFPHAGSVEDNLKPGDRIYRFNAECYQNTNKAIKIWHDIWLPKSQIKIVWGELQIDYANVSLSIPRWLIKKTLLNDYLKVD